MVSFRVGSRMFDCLAIRFTELLLVSKFPKHEHADVMMNITHCGSCCSHNPATGGRSCSSGSCVTSLGPPWSLEFSRRSLNEGVRRLSGLTTSGWSCNSVAVTCSSNSSQLGMCDYLLTVWNFEIFVLECNYGTSFVLLLRRFRVF